MLKVFFDASVLIAALISPQGGSAKLLGLIKTKKIIGIASQTVIKEIQKHSQKIKKSPKEIFAFIKESNLLVRETLRKSEIQPFLGKIDVNDAHLLAGAYSTRCDYLVSLDKKHVLKPEVKKQFKNIKIINPKYFLQDFTKGG